eukprot:2201731-Lingulodinium_polyedra.AAC.1
MHTGAARCAWSAPNAQRTSTPHPRRTAERPRYGSSTSSRVALIYPGVAGLRHPATSSCAPQVTTGLTPAVAS